MVRRIGRKEERGKLERFAALLGGNGQSWTHDLDFMMAIAATDAESTENMGVRIFQTIETDEGRREENRRCARVLVGRRKRAAGVNMRKSLVIGILRFHLSL